MAETRTAPARFEYEAQTTDGRSVSGAIDAADLDDARGRLEALGLRVFSIQRAEAPARPRPMRGRDFLIFNQQLAQLAKAGLPLEHGLRMVARDIRGRRLARTIGQVADELDRGRPLSEAFEAHRGSFPTFYGRLLDAGVKANNLPGILLNLGRHLELIHRLRAVLWQSISYPLIVFLFALFVLGFVCLGIVPEFAKIYADFDSELPVITRALIALGDAWPTLALTVVIVLVAAICLWPVLLWMRLDRHFIDQCILPLPLIGPVVKRSMVARWCDTMKLCVGAGLDLPGSIRLSGEAVGSPALVRDGEALAADLEGGLPLGQGGRPAVLSTTVTGAIELSGHQSALVSTLDALSEMYQQQAEIRLSIAQTIISPLLLAFIGMFMSFVLAGLFMPLVRLMKSI